MSEEDALAGLQGRLAVQVQPGGGQDLGQGGSLGEGHPVGDREELSGRDRDLLGVVS